MKKYFICLLFSILFNYSFSQSPTWVAINDTSFYHYGFAYPGNPTISDTLNIKHYFYALGGEIGFQVVEFKYAQFDSTNIPFTNALPQADGDTLKAITNAIFGGTNSVTLHTQNIEQSQGFKGREISIKYNTLNQGRVVLCYARFYYRKDLLLTFTITGFEDDQTNLDANKNQFFNSISF